MTLPKIVPDTCKHSGVFFIYIAACRLCCCNIRIRKIYFLLLYLFSKKKKSVYTKCYTTIILMCMCVYVLRGRGKTLLVKSTKRKIIFILFYERTYISWEMVRKQQKKYTTYRCQTNSERNKE